MSSWGDPLLPSQAEQPRRRDIDRLVKFLRDAANGLVATANPAAEDALTNGRNHHHDLLIQKAAREVGQPGTTALKLDLSP